MRSLFRVSEAHASITAHRSSSDVFSSQGWTAHLEVFPEKEALMAPASIRGDQARFLDPTACAERS
jgi:hypothetical protein